jgi:hypothetical protein
LQSRLQAGNTVYLCIARAWHDRPHLPLCGLTRVADMRHSAQLLLSDGCEPSPAGAGMI